MQKTSTSSAISAGSTLNTSNTMMKKPSTVTSNNIFSEVGLDVK